MAKPGRKKLTSDDLCSKIVLDKPMTQEEYDKLRYSNKSNLKKESSYIIPKDNEKNRFIAGVVLEEDAFEIKAKNLNNAKNIYNSLI